MSVLGIHQGNVGKFLFAKCFTQSGRQFEPPGTAADDYDVWLLFLHDKPVGS